MMMFIQVSFLRRMAVDCRCRLCGCRYLAAMEGEYQGLCGQCLLIAFPSPMEEELLPVRQEVREIQT